MQGYSQTLAMVSDARLPDGYRPTQQRTIYTELEIVEKVEAHLLKDVRHIHHDPVVDDLVVVVEAVPVRHPHFDLATSRRKAEPFATKVGTFREGQPPVQA